ncbi:MAG: type II secretion system F family protein [Acetobacteraceae bacterium]|jgi:tight adherence protein C
MAAQNPWLAPALIGGFAVVLGLALLLWRDMRRSEQLSARLRMVRSGSGPSERDPHAGLPPVMRIVVAIGEAIARSGALSTRTLEELRQTLHVAGFRGEHGLGLFVGTKLLLVVGLPLLVLTAIWLSHINVSHPSAYVAVAAGLGLLAPDKVVQHLRARYLRALENGMPDALDMMVICGQAGLGLEASIERVGVEIRHAHPVVAEELTRTAHEMQVNADTRVALLNFGKRTGLEGARRLSAMLIQSMQYGTAMAVALRALSAEQRQEMLAKYETKAGRLPVLLTLPMIVFILPCVFLVVAGPAMVDVYRAMR